MLYLLCLPMYTQRCRVAITAGLFDLFEVELGVSVTTSYDWTQVRMLDIIDARVMSLMTEME